jgi:hypothetical protein
MVLSGSYWRHYSTYSLGFGENTGIEPLWCWSRQGKCSGPTAHRVVGGRNLDKAPPECQSSHCRSHLTTPRNAQSTCPELLTASHGAALSTPQTHAISIDGFESGSRRASMSSASPWGGGCWAARASGVEREIEPQTHGTDDGSAAKAKAGQTPPSTKRRER